MTAVADIEAGRPPVAMGWGGAMLAALVVALVRPTTWPVALAGFLARGGILAVLLPILVLPTPSGLANSVAEPATSVLFGHPSVTFVLLVIGVTLGVASAAIAGAIVGAWAERRGIVTALEVAVDEGFGPVAVGAPVDARLAGTLGGATTLRLLGLVPAMGAIALAGPALVDAAYREVILPGELTTPLLLRIVGQGAPAVALIAVSWLVGDAAASVAVRRQAIDGLSTGRAWLAGWIALARTPRTTLATALVTLVMVLVLVAPALLASTFGWVRVGGLLADDREPWLIALATCLFVAVWLGGLVLAGAAAAFRSAAWTFEIARRTGPSSHRR